MGNCLHCTDETTNCSDPERRRVKLILKGCTSRSCSSNIDVSADSPGHPLLFQAPWWGFRRVLLEELDCNIYVANFSISYNITLSVVSVHSFLETC